MSGFLPAACGMSTANPAAPTTQLPTNGDLLAQRFPAMQRPFQRRPDVLKAGRQSRRAAGFGQVADALVHLPLVGLQVAEPFHPPFKTLAPMPDHSPVAGDCR